MLVNFLQINLKQINFTLPWTDSSVYRWSPRARKGQAYRRTAQTRMGMLGTNLRNAATRMDCSSVNSLQRRNPFGRQRCGRSDCQTCTRDIKINCRTRGYVYEIECVDCRQTVTKQYRGQTGRSLYERMKEHFGQWEEGAEDSYLRKHAVQYHNGGTFEVDVRLLTQSYGKPTTRMISKAVHIQELPDDNSLNSKAEWTYVKLPRVAVTWTDS